MSKVAIVYWSGTGNTEAMADLFEEGVTNAGGEASLIQCSNFSSSDVSDYDAFAFGCPAMGDEELEDTEFEPMYDEVEPALDGKMVVLFGSYDWNNGEWMEYWEQRAEEAGVKMPLTFIPEGISVTTRENEDTEYLFIQNFGEKTETVSVSGDYEVLYGSTDENIAPLATRILKRKK